MQPGIYKHFKGHIYRVLGVAKHSEDLAEFVVYQNPEGDLWIRPLSMFQEKVMYEGNEINRFEFISE